MKQFFAVFSILLAITSNIHAEETMKLHLKKSETKTIEVPLEVGEVNVPNPEIADIEAQDFESHRSITIFAKDVGKTEIEFRDQDSKPLFKTLINVDDKSDDKLNNKSHVVTIHLPNYIHKTFLCGGRDNKGCNP